MSSPRFTRRKALRAAGAAGLGLGGLAAVTATAPLSRAGSRAVKPEPPSRGYPQPIPRLRVRQNVASLTDDQIASLRRGVAKMRSRDAADPTSWRFQANIHGTFDAVMNPLFNQCEHGTIQFFTWHRGYLHYFERILREAAGDPSLTLPYWDWTEAPALPSAFREPADPMMNSLFEPSRNINNGALLPSSVVVDDLSTAMNHVEFFTASFDGFSPNLEGSPHGAVHVLIGGLMSSVPTAANDPIFWLHHCNIDRLWDKWLNLGSGRMNPSDSAFLDQPYSFADANGQTVTRKVGDIISSGALGYRYDNVANPPSASPAPALAVAVAVVNGAAKKAADPPPEAPRASPPPKASEHQVVASSAPNVGAAPENVAPAAPAAGHALGFKAETVKLRLAGDKAGPALRSAARSATPAQPSRILLEIQGIALTETPNFTYEVFLNLDEEETAPERVRLHRVGTINFFGKGDPGGHAHGHGGGARAGAGAAPVKTFDQTFDATGVIARLRESGRWSDDELSVTFRPLTPIAPKGQEDELRQRSEASAKKANISYKAVRLKVAP